jgi:site-specific recombinase XerD
MKLCYLEGKFLSFIESQDIRQSTDITAKHIAGYISTLLGYSYKTVELELCGLRSFLRYLYENNLHTEQLVKAIPVIKARKQNRIPSVWTQENITKLLDAIDRGNPAGKRDCYVSLYFRRIVSAYFDRNNLGHTFL